MARAAAALLLGSIVVAGCHGERTDLVAVPDLYGESNRTAQQLLADRGLVWRYRGSARVWRKPPDVGVVSTSDDDLVIYQWPVAGTRVLPGEAVELETSCTLEPLPPGRVCID